MRVTWLCQGTVGLCGDGLICLAAHPTLEPAFHLAHHRPGPGPHQRLRCIAPCFLLITGVPVEGLHVSQHGFTMLATAGEAGWKYY